MIQRLDLLYAPLTIPLVSYHVKSFQRASSVVRPWPGGEKRRGGRVSHHEALCSDGGVSPHGCGHLVVPDHDVVLVRRNPPGAAVNAGLGAARVTRLSSR